MDMVRFVSTGSEATMAAIRVARGYSGKKDIVKIQDRELKPSEVDKIALITGIILPFWNIPLVARIIKRKSSEAGCGR
jgi:aspartate carbamoyltransferase regulatory subunit